MTPCLKNAAQHALSRYCYIIEAQTAVTLGTPALDASSDQVSLFAFLGGYIKKLPAPDFTHIVSLNQAIALDLHYRTNYGSDSLWVFSPTLGGVVNHAGCLSTVVPRWTRSQRSVHFRSRCSH